MSADEQQEELQPSATPPRRPIIYDELFYNWVPPDPTMAMCMALCAVADEVRALRKAQENLLEFNREATNRQISLHEEDQKQRAQTNLMMQQKMQKSRMANPLTDLMAKFPAPTPEPCKCGHDFTWHPYAEACTYGACECRAFNPGGEIPVTARPAKGPRRS